METPPFGQDLSHKGNESDIATLFQRLLLQFPPEISHAIAIQALKRQRVATKMGILRQKADTRGFEIPSLPGLRFKSRLGMAAGFDKNAEVIPGLEALGFGFVEVGTVTPRPQPGNPKPRIWRTKDETLVNALGFNNCGGDEFLKNLKASKSSIPVFANIGKNKDVSNEGALDDYRSLFNLLGGSVSGFVVNVSSPNTPGLRSLQSIEFLTQVAKVAPTHCPILIKLAPDLSDQEFYELASFVAREPKLRGLVLTNTSRSLAVERENRAAGGLSGPPLFERTCQLIAIARPILGKQKAIIGVGGVNSVTRANTLRELGADLVEIYTGLIYQGPNLVREITRSAAFLS